MATPEQHFRRFRERGEPDALAAVFDELASELLLVAAHVAPAGVEAEDLVQATFLDAIERAGRWDGQRRLAPWLIGILVNHARGERRRVGRRVDAARLDRPPVPDPADAAELADSAERVAEAVRSMPLPYRQVLTLRLVHGLTPQQIGPALGCPVATVKTRLQRGLELLRRTLPAGVAGAVALRFASGSGLAQVRAAVLEQARLTGATTAVGVTTAVAGTIGALTMKKLVAVAAIVLLALPLLPFVLPPTSTGAPDSTAPGAQPVAAQGAEVATRSDASTAQPVERRAAERRAADAGAPASGSLAFEFVWSHDGSPARGLSVTLDPSGDGTARRRHAYSDRDGKLVFDGVPPGRAAVFGFDLWHSVDVRAGERLAERVEVDPGVVIEGRVVDARGQGVAGARVFQQYFPSSRDREPRLVAESRADGTFVAAMDSDQTYLWARKAGNRPSRCELVGPGHERRDGHAVRTVEFVLGDAAALLRGTVAAADGGPCRDARVTVLAQRDRSACPAPIELRTDERGVFTSEELAPGPHLVVVEAAGHALHAVEVEVVATVEAFVDMRLGTGATLVGEVCGGVGGDPVAATVGVRPAWANDAGAFVESLRPIYNRCLRQVVTGAGGTFRIENVCVGASRMQVQPRDDAWLQHTRTLELRDGATERLVVELVPSGGIAGRLLGPDGKPLAGWRVLFDPDGGGRMTDCDTDELGNFRGVALDAETYTVTAFPVDDHARGGLPWVRAEGVRPGGAELTLRTAHALEHGAHLVGRAVDEAGHALAGLLLYVENDRGGTVAQRVQVAADGSFSFGPMPPGSRTVSVALGEQGQHGGLRLGELVFAAGGTVDVGELRPPGRGVLQLTFLDGEGRTFEADDMRVFGVAGNGTAEFEPVPGARGAYRSGSIPAGRYTLFAWGERFARVRQQVEVEAGRTAPTVVLVEAAVPVTFVVRLDGGGDGARDNATVRLVDAHGDWAGNLGAVPVDADGARRTRGLRPGSYRFEAWLGHDGERVTGAFDVGPAAETAAEPVEVLLPAR